MEGIFMERKQILEYFEQYQEETQDRITAGIEQNRKGYGYITVTGRGWKACAKCAGCA